MIKETSSALSDILEINAYQKCEDCIEFSMISGSMNENLTKTIWIPITKKKVLRILHVIDNIKKCDFLILNFFFTPLISRLKTCDRHTFYKKLLVY